jgi:hypothetical protein
VHPSSGRNKMTKKQSPLLQLRDYFLLPFLFATILLILNQITVMGLENGKNLLSLINKTFVTLLLIATIGFSIGVARSSLLIIFATSLLVTLYISGPVSFLTSIHVMVGGWLLLRFIELKFNVKLIAKAFLLLIGFSMGLVFMTFKYTSFIGKMSETTKVLIVEQFGDNEYLDFKRNFDKKMAEQ